MNIALWIIQILLALLFLVAGVPKLIIAYEELMKMGAPNQVVFPAWFIKFIGVTEVLGALGLVLPGLFRRNQNLTVLAAIGLAIIMAGAVVATAMGPGIGMAITPFVVLLLCLFVAYGRTKLSPHK